MASANEDGRRLTASTVERQGRMTRHLSAMLVVPAAMILAACGTAAPVVDNLGVTWTLTPDAPVVGQDTRVDLTLRLPDGGAVTAARFDLEGHMTHPGMAPVVVPLAEAGEGRYRANLTLTMSGGWVFVVSGRLNDGRQVRQRLAEVVARAAE